MATKTEIANLAISHLGIGKEIQDLDTENSQEANACRRFYDITRRKVLRDFAWPFASKYYTLELISERPNNEWAYSYRYPTDCLDIQRIVSGVRNDSRSSRVVYKISQGTNGLLILNQLREAEIVYTVDTTNTSFFTDDFIMAFSYLLSHYIAPRITGGDPFGRGDKAINKYMMEISNAKANAANEEPNEVNRDSELIQAREGLSSLNDDDNFVGYY